MPKTYYDSELTGAQIESALEAIHGVVTPSNNGKVLYIDNGQIKAASASRWGHGAVLEPLSVTANGDYTPPTGTDGFDSVHVAVPGATLTTKSITQNGTYNASSDNADGYSSVTVDVQGGGSAVVQPLSVTQNGTYNPPSGVDGYAPVTVNVSGGGDDPFALKNYIESSGTQYIDTGYVPNDKSKFKIVCELTKNGLYPCIYGSINSSNNNRTFLQISSENSTNGSYEWRGTSGNIVFNNTSYIGQKLEIVVDKNGIKLQGERWFDCIGLENINVSNLNISFNLFIFSLNRSGNADANTFSQLKLYRFQILEDDAIVHEFIPWQENGVACLKDTVTGNLFYNAGTGDFVYGTDA